jgi:predicted MFS family arabinose efflux permease
MGPILIVGALGFGSVGLTIGSIPLWSLSHGVSREYVGLLTTAMFASTVVGQALVPLLMRLIGPGKSLAVAMLALGAPSLLYPLVSGFAEIALLSVVRGAGFAILTVAGLSVVAAAATENRRGANLSVYGLAGALPNLFATPAGVLLAQAGLFGWVCIAASGTLLALPAALKIDRVLPKTPRASRGDTASAAVLRSAVAVLPAAGIVLVVAMAIGGLTTFLPIARRAGVLVAAALFAMSVSAILAKWLTGPLSDRARPRLLAATALATTTVGMGAIWIALLAHLDVVLLAGLAIFGAGYGVLTNVTLVAALRRSGLDQGIVAIAVWNIALDVGQALGAATTGLLASTGLALSGAFGVNAGLLGLASGVTWAGFFRSGRRRRR